MSFDGFHTVPKRNLKTPISFMAGTPFANMNTHIKIVENIDTHEEDIIGFNESLPPSLFIFKTIVDPFVGRESLFKVCTGHIQTGMSLLNVNKNEVEKVNKLYIKRGKELIEVDELCAGDIGCMTKTQRKSGTGYFVM